MSGDTRTTSWASTRAPIIINSMNTRTDRVGRITSRTFPFWRPISAAYDLNFQKAKIRKTYFAFNEPATDRPEYGPGLAVVILPSSEYDIPFDDDLRYTPSAY